MPLPDNVATWRARRTHAMSCMQVAGVVAMFGGVWSVASVALTIVGDSDGTRALLTAGLGVAAGVCGWKLYRQHAALAGLALTLLGVFDAWAAWARTGSVIGLGVGTTVVLLYVLGWRGAVTYAALTTAPPAVLVPPEPH